MPPGGTPRRPRQQPKRRFGKQRQQVVRWTTWVMVIAMFLTVVVYLLATAR